MRYTIKACNGRKVTDYTVHGDDVDLTRAMRELEGKGAAIIHTCEDRITMDDKPQRRSLVRTFGIGKH